ncbi:TonB-dependent receptor [Novosphingobium naphthalenivorans]|uniref:TonB-dependent receptor n=1 Tax=Novosphingobium naphthalenivorans TaxID=273168 RepID=UPI00082B3136|nr:TonB-dependent receptor [Novosphingobium naphthalenivorans]
MPHDKIRSRRFAGLTGLSLAALAAGLSAPAWADESGPGKDTDADTVIAEGSDIIVTGTRANEIAPVTASLHTTEPQAIVSRSFIEDSLPATADFNQLALITPSFTSTGGDGGMGISESKGQLRGFQDGEYNITYDGVPFGDTNDPTHHSNTFFPSNTIETVVVDRGPGNASNLGQATFGGSVNLFSRATREDMGADVRASYGTNNTWLIRPMLQSGAIKALGGTEVLLGGQYVHTDGVRSYAPYHQLNLFGKAVIPIGPDVKLTLLSTYNKNHFNQPDNDGPTLQQVQDYGKHYLLNNDPTSSQYWKYNYTNKTTDFELVKLEADIAPGVRFENRAYTYFYNNSTYTAADTTVEGGTVYTAAALGATSRTSADGLPGYAKLNSYRTYGDIMKAMVQVTPWAKITAGGWIEWNVTHRKRYEYDIAAGGYGNWNYNQKYTGTDGKTHYTYINYDQDSHGNQEQLFAELELQPISGLKITPGFKYLEFTRSISAIANQKTHLPAHFSESWHQSLPFLTANYMVTNNLSAYAQYAKGFLAPPLSVLYNIDPSNNTVKPQTSDNYQVGMVYHGSHLSIDADYYHIDFNNKFANKTVDGDKVFYNLGGVVYEGVEGQITYAFNNGLALFVNGSLNDAKDKDTKLQVAKAPKGTAAAGVLYKHGPVKFSLIDKYTGVQYADDANTPGYRISPYHNTILSIGYDFGIFAVEGTVSDLFNSEKVTSIDINDGPAGDITGNDQYHFQPGREASISLKAKF